MDENGIAKTKKSWIVRKKISRNQDITNYIIFFYFYKLSFRNKIYIYIFFKTNLNKYGKLGILRKLREVLRI